MDSNPAPAFEPINLQAIAARQQLLRSVVNAVARGPRKRRRGFSAKCYTARMRGSVLTVHRRRLAVPMAFCPFDTYQKHDAMVGARLRAEAAAR